MFRPLSDARHRPLGMESRVSRDAEDEVTDLPGSVFFSGRLLLQDRNDPLWLFYKDQVSAIRRVSLTAGETFRFSTRVEPEQFDQVGEIVLVPEMDPRAWAAASDQSGVLLDDIARLSPGACFTALGATENLASQRRGVYRLSPDGLFRRLLKDPMRGMEWSEPIPADRFGALGTLLALQEGS